MTFGEQFWPQFVASIASGIVLAGLGYGIGYFTRHRIARAIRRSIDKIEGTGSEPRP